MTNFKESNLSMTAKLAVNLIKIPSITPNDLGCLDLIKARLSPLGFNCITLEDSGTTNLLALHGTGSPFFLFLGHTDVVSPGNDADWSFPPFGAEIKNIEGTDYLQGRGSQDMKSSDAAMTEALVSFVEANPNHKGCVGILLTSNEEGDAKGGTPFVVEYLKEHNLIPDYCLVGEPSCVDTFGDTIKNGRRGSLTAHITVLGVQGHVAYPQRCDKAAAKAAFKPLVYICSPFSGDIENNNKRTRAFCRFALDKGNIPLAPHLMFPQFMDDNNEQERDQAIFMDIILMGKCQEVWVLGDVISRGMSIEIEKAKKRRQPVRYFNKDFKEVESL